MINSLLNFSFQMRLCTTALSPCYQKREQIALSSLKLLAMVLLLTVRLQQSLTPQSKDKVSIKPEIIILCRVPWQSLPSFLAWLRAIPLQQWPQGSQRQNYNLWREASGHKSRLSPSQHCSWSVTQFLHYGSSDVWKHVVATQSACK